MEPPRQPDTRDRPFEPPQQGSLGVGIVALLLAAAAIYGIVQWRQTTEAVPANRAISKPVTQAPAGPVAVDPGVPTARTNGLTVTKCIAQGRTIYSDGACPAGSTSSALHIQRDLNLSQATQVAAVNPPESPDAAMRTVQTAANTVNKAQCDALEEVAKSIDAEARLPQSPQKQDHLTQRKREVRDAMFRLKC